MGGHFLHACVELVHARDSTKPQRWKDTFGARADVSLAHLRQTIELNRDSFVGNEMGNEQLEAGNTSSEGTCWRKSSSSVDWPEWNDCGSDVPTETCERSVEHAREAPG